MAQGWRDGGMHRGCGAQLAFVPFLMGMLEVGAAQGRPSCARTAAAARAMVESLPESPARAPNSAIFQVLVPFAGWTGFHCNGLRGFRVRDGATQTVRPSGGGAPPPWPTLPGRIEWIAAIAQRRDRDAH